MLSEQPRQIEADTKNVEHPTIDITEIKRACIKLASRRSANGPGTIRIFGFKVLATSKRSSSNPNEWSIFCLALLKVFGPT